MGRVLVTLLIFILCSYSWLLVFSKRIRRMHTRRFLKFSNNREENERMNNLWVIGNTLFVALMLTAALIFVITTLW
jgi:hypothetical protein